MIHIREKEAWPCDSKLVLGEQVRIRHTEAIPDTLIGGECYLVAGGGIEMRRELEEEAS